MSLQSNNLKNKTILVLGGSSGIGYAVAQAALQSGANLIISSSTQDKVDKAVSKLHSSASEGSTIVGYTCNLKGPQMEEDIKSLFDKIDTLNHVVITASDPLAFGSLDKFDYKSIVTAGEVRLFSAILIAKHAYPKLPQSKESSITFTSGAIAYKPRPNFSVVGAFGASLHGLTRGLALELSPVRVNLISPGTTDTELWNGMPSEMKQARMKLFEETSLTKSVGTPEEVAKAYVYALTCEFVTGAIMQVDGGSILV